MTIIVNNIEKRFVKVKWFLNYLIKHQSLVDKPDFFKKSGLFYTCKWGFTLFISESGVYQIEYFFIDNKQLNVYIKMTLLKTGVFKNDRSATRESH